MLIRPTFMYIQHTLSDLSYQKNNFQTSEVEFGKLSFNLHYIKIVQQQIKTLVQTETSLFFVACRRRDAALDFMSNCSAACNKNINWIICVMVHRTPLLIVPQCQGTGRFWGYLVSGVNIEGLSVLVSDSNLLYEPLITRRVEQTILNGKHMAFCRVSKK